MTKLAGCMCGTQWFPTLLSEAQFPMCRTPIRMRAITECTAPKQPRYRGSCMSNIHSNRTMLRNVYRAVSVADTLLGGSEPLESCRNALGVAQSVHGFHAPQNVAPHVAIKGTGQRRTSPKLNLFFRFSLPHRPASGFHLYPSSQPSKMLATCDLITWQTTPESSMPR